MPVQTLKKSEKSAKSALKTVVVPIIGNTTFDRKAEEMKIFLSLNPVPEEFLKKK
jgi:3-keto-L-gulonate-6-phosphate decarboxylase